MTISLLKFNFSLVMCPSGHIWWNQFLLPCGGRSAEMFIFSPCFKMPKMKHTEVHWTDKDRFKEVQVNWGTYTHSIQNMKKMRPETNTSILFSIQTGLIDNGPNFPTKNSEAKLYSHPSQSLHYLAQINHFISWKLTKFLNNKKTVQKLLPFPSLECTEMLIHASWLKLKWPNSK